TQTLYVILISISCISMRLLPGSTLFPYTTLFRSQGTGLRQGPYRVYGIFGEDRPKKGHQGGTGQDSRSEGSLRDVAKSFERGERSEEHTSELQSRENLVCRLQLEKQKIKRRNQQR